MKKVIFMTYDFPYPFNSGGKIRAYNLLKYAHTGFDIRLISFTRGEVASRYLKKLSDIGVSNTRLFPRPKNSAVMKAKSLVSSKNSVFFNLYYSPVVEAALIKTIEQEHIDILHCESFYTGYYMNDRVKNTGVKTVFGTENIEHKLYNEYVKTSVKPFLKTVYTREVQKIKREEDLMLQNADLTLAVSTDEQEYFDQISHDSLVVENGIDLEYFQFRPRVTEHITHLFFVGNFKYFPNIDAVKFIYEQIFKHLPSGKFQLTIIGKDSEKLPIPRDRDIKLIDYIDDIRDAYAMADIFLFPVQFGGGTNFKVLEAMATGVPIVGNPERMNALHAVDGKHYFAATTKDVYLNQIERLWTSSSKNSVITKNARVLIEKNYGWDTIGKKLNKAWKSL